MNKSKPKSESEMAPVSAPVIESKPAPTKPPKAPVYFVRTSKPTVIHGSFGSRKSGDRVTPELIGACFDEFVKRGSIVKK